MSLRPCEFASVSLGMFALNGLELLGVLDENVSEKNRKAWIEWIYAQQRIPSSTDPSGKPSFSR